MPAATRPSLAAAALLAVLAVPGSSGCQGAGGAPGTFEVRPESLVVRDTALSYSFRVAYPQVEGEDASVAAVNRAMADTVRAMMTLYRPPEPPPPGLPYEAEVEGGFETALAQDSLFSALLSAYAYTGGAHGMQDARALNFDLRTGTPVRLAALFRRDAPWLDTLAARSTRRLVRRLGPGVLFEERVPPNAAAFGVFTLEPDSLAVHFPPYAVAAYAAGPQRVAFAYAELAPLLDRAGPLRLLLRRAN